MDNAIVFSAIAHKIGYLIGHSSRDRSHDEPMASNTRASTQPLLNNEQPTDSQLSDAEMEKYTFHTGILCGLHKSWEHKFGRINQFVAYYDEITLVTVMLDDNHFLLIGIDVSKNELVNHIISQKVVPFLENNAISLM